MVLSKSPAITCTCLTKLNICSVWISIWLVYIQCLNENSLVTKLGITAHLSFYLKGTIRKRENRVSRSISFFFPEDSLNILLSCLFCRYFCSEWHLPLRWNWASDYESQSNNAGSLRTWNSWEMLTWKYIFFFILSCVTLMWWFITYPQIEIGVGRCCWQICHFQPRATKFLVQGHGIH